MQRLFLIVLILAFGVTSADARSGQHRPQGYSPKLYIAPAAAQVMPRAEQSDEFRQRRGATVPPFDEPQRRGRYSSPADLVPPDWQLQPADSNRNGQRFLSPDG